MLNIIVVDDDKKCTERLLSLIYEYKTCTGKEIAVSAYSSGDAFLFNYKAGVDIVFMDIKMPGMNGMDTARKLRQIDQRVILIFVTDMMQYAIEGYEVDALDYILKPVSYASIAKIIDKAVLRLGEGKTKFIIVKHNGILQRIPILSIEYIEVRRHRIFYHTMNGCIEDWGSLGDIENELPSDLLVRCNREYIVGLSHVKSIKDSTVIVGEKRIALKISRNRKKDFIAEFSKFIGGKF